MSITQQPAKPSKKAGFTLVELLVTTAITSIILLTASTILMTFFLSNTRTSIRRQLKAEGARAEAKMEFVARGAKSCLNPPNNTADITFTNLDNSTVRFRAEDVNWGGGIIVRNILMTTTAQGGGTGVTENLLSQFARVDTDNFLLECVRVTSNQSKQYANMRFQLRNPGNDAVIESFQTIPVLRNSQ